jgi:membrane-associated phospholipid phosphatase
LFTVDKNIQKFSQSNQSEINNKVFNLDAYYGNAYTAIFTSAIYGYGLFAKDKNIRKLGLNASEAFIYSIAITGIFKAIIGRRRPYAGENHLFFKPLQITDDTYHSLPSGHTTAVFAVSTVMANFSDNTIWKVFWYGTAGLVGASRIYHNKHWASDVFLGAAIGYFVGSFTVNFDKEESKYFGISVSPYFTFNEIGVSLKF